MKSSTIVSVIVPVNKPNMDISGFMHRLSKILEEKYSFYEILLMDDSCDRETEKFLTDLTDNFRYIRYIQLSRRYGREISVFAGLETALGDFVVIMDAETDPPEMIPELVTRCSHEDGILTGIADKRRYSGFLAGPVSAMFHAYIKKYLKMEYRENSTDFRVLSRHVVNAILRVRDKRRHIKVFSAGLGKGNEYFTYSLDFSRTNHSLKEQVKTGFDIIIANSRHPLRIASRLGIFISLLNLLYIVYIISIYLFKSQVAPGWTTTSMQMTVMFFFLFLILAILCEYVGLILEESQDRPLYQVQWEKNSTVSLEDSIRKNIVNQSEP